MGSVSERKKKAPTAAIIDSQSVKTAQQPGIRGYDAGKKVVGRKRHILVDTLGFILMLKVHAANTQDRDGGCELLKEGHSRFGWLRKIWADGGYAGKPDTMVSGLKRERPIDLEIVKRNQVRRFEVLPKRWIVERTFGWLLHSRRLAKDYEVKTGHSEAIILISMTKRMLQRIA